MSSSRMSVHVVRPDNAGRRLAIWAAVLALAFATASIPATTSASPAAAAKECNGLKATIVGTPGDDHIVGTGGADVIVAGEGDDVIKGRGGKDVICGRAGDDEIRGGKGQDHLRGGSGTDLVVGGAGADELRGGKQSDDLRGGKGDDLLNGGKAVDDCDGGAGFNTFVSCENTPNTAAPVATDDTAGTTEDASKAVEVLANDTDADGDLLLIISIDTTGTTGTVTITGGGTAVSYSPNGQFEALGAGATGADSFSYVVSDGNGGTDAASVAMTITGIDDAPQAVADTKTVDEDSNPTTTDVRSNDTDVDAGPKTVTAATQPAHGTVAITNGGNDLSYSPDANYCNDPGVEPADTFTYTLNGGSTATVSVTVTCVDDAGTAANDTATVTEDDPATTIDVLANDTDIDGGSVSSVTQPANGTVVITNSGADLTYEPNPNFCNDPPGTTTDDFTYTVPGGSTATVAVTVTCADDAPVAVDDTKTVAEDAAATTIDVRANDTDVDGGPTTIESVTQPANGTVVITNNGDDLTYEPDPDYCNSGAGPDDTFSYTLNGGSTATVAVTVTCADDATVAVNDTKTVVEDAAATSIEVRANDTDVDGGPKTIESVTQPTNGAVVITNGGDDLTYEPDPNYCNNPPGTTTDDFTYTLNGGSTATVSVTVTCVDDDPVAVDDTATVSEDDPATLIDVRANDTDVDGGAMTVDSVTQPANGAVLIATGGLGLTYEPDPDYCNDPPGTTTDDFTYTLNGGSTATVAVTVTCVDDDPVAVDDTTTMTEDDPATTISVRANDTDVDGGPKTIDSVTQPANGTVVITNAGADLTYEPDADYCNSGAAPDDTFTYTLNGGSTATVSVIVTCVDDAGTAVNDTATVTEDDPATTIDVLANDTDVEGDAITITQVTQPTNGTVVITNNGDDLTYEPDANYCNSGAGPDDTFTYTINGGDTATVSVTVTCVDDDPVAVDDTATVTMNTGVNTVDVLANDTDIDAGPLTITQVNQPANGTVVITNNGDDLTYEPDADYCNDGTPTDDFTYAVNGGSTATVAVTVVCDVPPVAVNDTKTVAEDAAATSIDVRANDTDVDGGPKTIESVTQPANGTVVITNAGDDLTYEPDPNYCNNPPGTTTDDFTYTLNGGSTATVAVTVTCVDDNPVAVDDTKTVTEDDPATAIDVLANDTDVDGGQTAISSASDPANGTVVLTGGSPGAHTGLTYQPDPNYCNDPDPAPADTFTYTLNGGSTATVSVTVTCVADPPTIDNSAGSTSYTENAPATVVDGAITITNSDGLTITAGSANISNNFSAGDVLDWVDNNLADNITEGASTNQTLLLTGDGTAAQYEAALEAVTYRNTSDNPSTSPRDVTFSIATSAGSPRDTKGITVTAVDDPPNAVNDSATVAEDAAATAIDVLGNDTDPDAGPKTISSASDPANGTVVLTGGPPATGLTYQPDPNYCNDPPGTTPDTFTYTVNGGSTASVSVTVTCSPDNPVVDTSAGSTGYTENAAATVIDGAVTVTDPDAGTTIFGATVKITGNYAGAQDVLALANPGNHPGITASLTGDTLTLSGNATLAAYQSALRDVTYFNNSENPSTLARTVTFTVTDDTARSGSDTKGITVTAVDDPPTAVNDSATVLEDAAATAVTVLTNDTDPDAGPKAINAVTQPANGTVVITGGGSGLTYAPNPNYCNTPPGTTPDTFTYTLNGGSTATVSMTVTCVNDAPVADDETFNAANSAVGNTPLVIDDPTDAAPTLSAPKKSITGDILAGDTDIDSPAGGFTVTAGTFATANGGSVIVEADGDFTFFPEAVASCTDASDSFNYTLNDNDALGNKTDTGAVTIALAGCVWYVSNNGAGNSGTATAPFDTLAQAESASAAGHTIFVFDGDDTTLGYAAGINLKANQVLTSEVANLVVGGATLWTGVAGKRPTITDNNADVVDLAAGNTVRGFTIDPQGTGGGIFGGTGDAGGTIDNINITDAGTRGTQPGLELDTTTGTFNVSDLTINNGDANNATALDVGIRLNNAGTVVFAPGSAISVITQSAKALDLTGTALGTSTFDEINVSSSGSGGLSLVNTTGAISLGDDLVADISLTTSGGTGFLLNNAGAVVVGGGGTDSVFATNGPAVDITGPFTAGVPGSFTFDDTDSTSSTTDGINLDNFGTGTFSTGSGSAISGTTGIGFDLNQGNANVSYDGTISTTAAGSRPVEVTNRGGGTVDFNGTVNGTALGVNLTTNPSATIRFDGGLTLSTGATIAFNATGGGTVVVTDPNAAGTAPDNTLTTTTASALNVTSTDIGTDDLNFKSISVNGAGTGILLSATGSSGGLTVTGTGTTDGSGGTIQAITNRGASFLDSDQVSLANMNFTNAATTNGAGSCLQLSLGTNTGCNAPINLQDVITATLTNLNINGSAQQGINGRNVTGFTLTDSVLTGIGNAADEDGIHFFNMLGTSTITNTSVTGSFDDNMIIQNSGAGSGTVTVNETVAAASTFSQSTQGSGIVLGARLGASLKLSVDDTTFDNNFSGGIPGTASDDPAVGNDASLLQVVVTDSTFVNNNDGIDMSATQQSSTRFNIANNTFNNDFVEVGVLGGAFSTAGVVEGAITGNTMTTPNGQTSDAIVINAAGGDAVRVNVANNTMPYAGTQRAINIQGGQDGNGSANVTVTNNSIDLQLDGTGNAVTGIFAQMAVTGPGNSTSLCVDLGGAAGLRNTFTHSLGGNIAAGDIRLRQRFDGTVRLPGYAGGATDLAAVVAYLAGRNTLVNSPTATATADSTGYAGGAACTQPVLPN